MSDFSAAFPKANSVTHSFPMEITRNCLLIAKLSSSFRYHNGLQRGIRLKEESAIRSYSPIVFIPVYADFLILRPDPVVLRWTHSISHEVESL
jgi:hypothetical protein